MMDPARISPVAKYFYSITPLPTHPQVNPLVEPNWIGPTRIPNRQNTTSIRIDHRFSDKDLLYGRVHLWHKRSLARQHSAERSRHRKLPQGGGRFEPALA